MVKLMTTLWIRPETKDRIKRHATKHGETLDTIINRLIDLAEEREQRKKGTGGDKVK